MQSLDGHAFFKCLSDSTPNIFDECFQFFDEKTQEPIRSMPYRIEYDGIITYSGYTDDDGKTLRVYTENVQILYVYYGKELKICEEENG